MFCFGGDEEDRLIVCLFALIFGSKEPFLHREEKQLRQKSAPHLPLQGRSLHHSHPFSLLLAYITFLHQEE